MSLTAAQQAAVAARGNVLVMAGAGTGKTSTLVERCIDCLSGKDAASLDELLVVTFTEAAAAEARERIRAALERKHAESGDEHWARQLALFDAAHIGTLHGFCLKLIRQHFYQLGLDPQVAVLDEGQARMLAEETLTELLEEHYAGTAPEAVAVQELIETYATGRDPAIRRLVLQLHHYRQTRSDPQEWFARQLALFADAAPAHWRDWLLAGIADWRELWLAELESLRTCNPKAAECADILRSLSTSSNDNDVPAGQPADASRAEAAEEVAARRSPGAVFEEILLARDGHWPAGRKTELKKPLEAFFEDAGFLATLLSPTVLGKLRQSEPDDEEADQQRAEPVLGTEIAADPLTEDWNWCRAPMLALLQLADQFTARFAERKRADGVLDFHDLEQFALQLLWEKQARAPASTATLDPREPERPKRAGRGRSRRDDSQQLALPIFGRPEEGSALPVLGRSVIAQHWREKFRFVFVDEYQDINAAQDRIITALSREGPAANRFLVGDVKQSIYRFRLAEPAIFRAYARDWQGETGTTIPLRENFRSRAAILEFANALFAPLLREDIGGVQYDAAAKLIPAPSTGSRAAGATSSDVELCFRLTERNVLPTDGAESLEDLQEAEKEARHVAGRLRELRASGCEIFDRESQRARPLEWRDMAVLLRAPAGKAEGYAKQFERLGVPLLVERGGFFDAIEVADLMNLLRSLDNPLQDVPLLAVLRSPLVALSLNELATIRLTSKGPFWTALVRFGEARSPQTSVLSPGSAQSLASKVGIFLERFARWRKLARQVALSRCLDAILADTHYPEWLRVQERGAQRSANVQRLLRLAEQYDQFQRQGLFRFLRFVEAQRDAGAEPEVAAAAPGNAVRLMSIHQSKGLEFPVVVVADLGKPFNFQDLRAEIILDEEYGLCPQVRPPGRAVRYPSAAQWLARQRQRRELLGEEMRLLYVALTRARERLILVGSLPRTKWDKLGAAADFTSLALLSARNSAEWLRLWLARHGDAAKEHFSICELDDAHLIEPTEPNNGSEPGDDALSGGEPAISSLANDESLHRLRAALTWEYAFTDSTTRAAKTSVTALRRAAAEEMEAQEAFVPAFRRATARSLDGVLSATDIGNAHHRFLQHVELVRAGDANGLQAEADRLQQEKVISREEAAALDFAALERFWRSPVGEQIRAQDADSVKRELPFTARFTPAELDAIVHGTRRHDFPNAASGEFVVVQGVADLVVLLPEEIWLLDFKTDALTKSGLEAKTLFYAPQLQLYARALERIYARRVTKCWLHFLACGETMVCSGTAVPVA